MVVLGYFYRSYSLKVGCNTVFVDWRDFVLCVEFEACSDAVLMLSQLILSCDK